MLSLCSDSIYNIINNKVQKMIIILVIAIYIVYKCMTICCKAS
uniref:Uncharacterized protein n=1 Tax=Amphimedon queenslandica TaxID=400682 RepID=A0A1X7U9Y2_AMPQE